MMRGLLFVIYLRDVSCDDFFLFKNFFKILYNYSIIDGIKIFLPLIYLYDLFGRAPLQTDSPK
jgi:hypothetical protein